MNWLQFYLLFICFVIRHSSVYQLLNYLSDNASLKTCVPLNSIPETRVKTVNNKHCFFPFTYINKTYDDCIPYGATANKFCPTTCNLESDNELSLCRWEKKNILEPSCENITFSQPYEEPSTTTNKSCMFPFVYKGKCYNDCISLDSYQLWCGATESSDLNPNSYLVCYYNRSINEKKGCENLKNAKPSIHPETTNNGVCTFPFVYKNTCYEDCVPEAEIWCSFTKGYRLNEFGYCKYLKNFTKYEAGLKYGIYTISSNCSQGDFCDSQIVTSNSIINSKVQIAYNNSKYMVNKWEILPQPNNSVIIRTPRMCPLTIQTAWQFNLQQLVLGELKEYKANSRFILNPNPKVPNNYFLTVVIGENNITNSIIGFQMMSKDKADSIPLESYPLPIYWTFKLIKELDVNVHEDPCVAPTNPPIATTQTTKEIPVATNNKLESEINGIKITVSVTIAISSIVLIMIIAIIIIMYRNH